MLSKKWGVEYFNAYMVCPNGFSNSGNNWVKSAAKNPIETNNIKGMRYKNRHKSAARDKVFIPFTHIKAEKKKKNRKENEVGAVSKNTA